MVTSRQTFCTGCLLAVLELYLNNDFNYRIGLLALATDKHLHLYYLLLEYYLIQAWGRHSIKCWTKLKLTIVREYGLVFSATFAVA